MPCVSKPSCTHGIIVSLWLICCVQCGFSISYLSIPGIVAHDRCNIYHISTFSFQFQYPMLCCAFHLHNCFSGQFKTGQRGRKVGGQGCWVMIICFKILACNFSQCLQTSFLLVHNGIYYCYQQQYSHHHYYHYHCYGYYVFICTINNIIFQITIKHLIISLKAIYYKNNGMSFILFFLVGGGLSLLFDWVLLFNVFCFYFCFIIIIIIFIIIDTIIIIIICFVFNLFVNVCINVLYPLIFFFMPQVKDQQSHSLHLTVTYFIFVITILRLTIFKFYDFVFLLQNH